MILNSVFNIPIFSGRSSGRLSQNTPLKIDLTRPVFAIVTLSLRGVCDEAISGVYNGDCRARSTRSQ
jgi:hypothetical protein